MDTNHTRAALEDEARATHEILAAILDQGRQTLELVKALIGAEGPSVRKRTLAYCTQC
jgi:hypothetical protein